MQDWLGRSVLPPGRFADLRPGNFVAFYSANSEPEFIVYSYGPTNYDMSVFIKQKLSLDLYQKPWKTSLLFILIPPTTNTCF